ncbi:MAG: hypothetical protein TREMPRED_004997 [Tremellales sp. Tagirdzhanova-0007]|nr:MAG: hypothetical protein TREMPRED_004997 [Tremellales sp. Tagirdzhanova-0007]
MVTPNGDSQARAEGDRQDPDIGRFLLKENIPLPKADVLKSPIVEDENPARVVAAWIVKLSKASGDGDSFADLFWEYGVWRDRVVFTFDHRTFIGRDRIRSAAKDLLPRAKATGFTVITPLPKLNNMPGGLNYIQASMSFETTIASATAVVNLVKTTEGYKAWTMVTMIEGLLDYPELPGPRGGQTEAESWQEKRDEELAFEERDPDVLIIGCGQCGLLLAARLEALGVSYLVVEREERIGDIWRNRYAMLNLHNPSWADQMPYLNYPSRWPTYTPAVKYGNWLELYAETLDLKYWTGCQVTSCKQVSLTNEWTVEVNRCQGKDGRKTLKAKHVVMATGFAGRPKMPKFPGMDSFEGEIRHSTQHHSAKGCEGKKMLVVGTGASGLDIALEATRRGLDVTILQRSPTYVMSLTNGVAKYYSKMKPGPDTLPIEVLDRLRIATPLVASLEMSRAQAKATADEDKDLLVCLSALMAVHTTKGGGFYFDQGAGEAIINGSIKVRQGSISRFNCDNVVFSQDGDESGSEKFDLVVMATGYHGQIDTTRRIMGEKISGKLRSMMGIDEEGESSGNCRQVEVPNLWYIYGGIVVARLDTKMLALRLKALLEGIAPKAYLRSFD